MPYLVDSNIVVDHLLDVPTASALLEQLALDGIAISIVTYMEAFQGVEQSPNPRYAREKFHAFLAGVLILPWEEVGKMDDRSKERIIGQNYIQDSAFKNLKLSL